MKLPKGHSKSSWNWRVQTWFASIYSEY